MSSFRARSVELSGGFTLRRPVDQVFDLFSPLGEELWAPGWSAELLHPPGAAWTRGLIFRTRAERGATVWIVTELDRTAHHVEYHRVDSERHVACVSVRCTALGPAATEVRVSYAYVGLSDDGNAELASMTAASYDEKMQQWKRWIETSLAITAPAP